MSLTSTEARELSNSRRCRSIREDPLPINPVIPAAGGSDTVIVDFVDYVARWAGYDAEECIQKAVEDDMVELYYRNPYGERGLDMYRLTAKGRRESDRHAREVFRKSAEAAKKWRRGRGDGTGRHSRSRRMGGNRNAPPQARDRRGVRGEANPRHGCRTACL